MKITIRKKKEKERIRKSVKTRKSVGLMIFIYKPRRPLLGMEAFIQAFYKEIFYGFS